MFQVFSWWVLFKSFELCCPRWDIVLQTSFFTAFQGERQLQSFNQVCFNEASSSNCSRFLNYISINYFIQGAWSFNICFLPSFPYISNWCAIFVYCVIWFPQLWKLILSLLLLLFLFNFRMLNVPAVLSWPLAGKLCSPYECCYMIVLSCCSFSVLTCIFQLLDSNRLISNK